MPLGVHFFVIQTISVNLLHLWVPPRSASLLPRHNTRGGGLVWNAFDVWKIRVKWSISGPPPSSKDLNNTTCKHGRHPNPLGPCKRASDALIQTHRHNLLISLETSSSRGRGDTKQTEGDKRNTFTLISGQAGRLQREESRAKLRFKVKDMKEGGSRQRRCWKLHLRTR